MKYTLYILFQLLIFNILISQEKPAPPQEETMAIVNVTIHIGNGVVIEQGYVRFDNGRISAIGNMSAIPNLVNVSTLDGAGQHLYPGFIAPNTPLGLTEVSAVSSTNDFNELGKFNPNVRSIVAYNTDSDIPPTIRSNGTLLAQVVPSGAHLSGTSSVVELDGWNWEDAAYAMDNGVHLDWPSIYRRHGHGSNRRIEKNEDYAKEVREIEQFFTQAAAYAKKKNPNPVNLKMQAVKGLLDNSKTLFIEADDVKAISQAVLFSKKHNIKMVLVGGRDSWMAIPLLKENNVGVIIEETQRLPSRPDADIDQPFKTPRLLQEGGVLFAFSIGGGWQQRNLPFQAGQAIGFGLEYEDAISALTTNTAKILGIDQTVGSIEMGKDATFFLCNGDPLDMRTNKLTHAFIQGKKITLENKQTRLAEKFQDKYGHE